MNCSMSTAPSVAPASTRKVVGPGGAGVGGVGEAATPVAAGEGAAGGSSPSLHAARSARTAVARAMTDDRRRSEAWSGFMRTFFSHGGAFGKGRPARPDGAECATNRGPLGMQRAPAGLPRRLLDADSDGCHVGRAGFTELVAQSAAEPLSQALRRRVVDGQGDHLR